MGNIDWRMIMAVVALLGMFGGGAMAYSNIKGTTVRNETDIKVHTKDITDLKMSFLEQSVDLNYLKDGQVKQDLKSDRILDLIQEIRDTR